MRRTEVKAVYCLFIPSHCYESLFYIQENILKSTYGGLVFFTVLLDQFVLRQDETESISLLFLPSKTLVWFDLAQEVFFR